MSHIAVDLHTSDVANLTILSTCIMVDLDNDTGSAVCQVNVAYKASCRKQVMAATLQKLGIA